MFEGDERNINNKISIGCQVSCLIVNINGRVIMFSARACCVTYRIRVMKAGVKSRLAQTPKSECFTSSHVEYFMSEHAGDGNAVKTTKIRCENCGHSEKISNSQ